MSPWSSGVAFEDHALGVALVVTSPEDDRHRHDAPPPCRVDQESPAGRAGRLQKHPVEFGVLLSFSRRPRVNDAGGSETGSADRVQTASLRIAQQR